MDNDLAAKLDRLVFQRDITQYADRIHVLPGPGLGDRWDFCKRKLAELNQQLTVAWNDEARTHVQQELERYQKELVHIEEKLAEQPPMELSAAPVQIETDARPVELPEAARGKSGGADGRRAEIREYKSRYGLKNYGNVAHHMKKNWNDRTVIDEFISGTGRPKDAEIIRNALAKNALI
jgi:hypothetical protein